MRSSYVGWLFLIPALFLLVFFTISPFIQVVNLSLREYSLQTSKPKDLGRFLSLENYRKLMQEDSEFWHSLKITTLYVIVVVTIEFFLGFILALLLNKEFKGKKLVVSLAIIPIMIAPVAVGIIWSLAVNNEFGILPYFLQQLGFQLKAALLGSSFSSFLTIMIVDIWQWTPYVFLVMLAGLQGLPKEQYEAIQVDGASGWQTFRMLTFPLLQPLIIVIILLRVIDAFKTFDQVWVLTAGGPGNATELVNIYAYRTNFRLWNLGYGAAVALVIYFVILIITALFFNITQKKEREV